MATEKVRIALKRGPKKRAVCDVTPAEAKVVWDSMKNPTAVKVSAAFRSCGRQVTRESIGNWRKTNWEPVEKCALNTPPPEMVSHQQVTLEDVRQAIGHLTGNPNIRLEDLVPKQIEGMPQNYRAQGLPKQMLAPVHDMRAIYQLIDGMTDVELLRATNRQAQGVCMVLFNEIDRQRMLLVNDNPEALGKLIAALAGFLDAANMGAKHYLDVRERSMLEINPNGKRGRGELDDDMSENLKAMQNVANQLHSEANTITVDASSAPRAPLQS